MIYRCLKSIVLQNLTVTQLETRASGGFLIIMIVIILSCNISCADNTSKKNCVENSDSIFYSNKFWISNQYLNCLEQKLPCECLEGLDYLLITFNPEFPDKFTLYENTLNKEELYSRYNGTDYSIYSSLDAPQPLFKVKIKNDTMYLTMGDQITKYVNYTKYDNYEKGIRLIGKLNIEFIKRLLNVDAFNFEKDLNIVDESLFVCNVELGYVNLIFNQGNCKNSWIIEKKGSKYLFYKYSNSCSAKTFPIIIEKELIYSVSEKK